MVAGIAIYVLSKFVACVMMLGPDLTNVASAAKECTPARDKIAVSTRTKQYYALYVRKRKKVNTLTNPIVNNVARKISIWYNV